MKIVKRTMVTVMIFLFTAVLALFLTVLLAAACSERVTLRFETFGGTPLGTVEGKAGESYPQPGEPQMEGHYFDGWYLDAALSGERQELPDLMPGESTTYYAKYTKYPSLTLETDGGTLGEREPLAKVGEPLKEFLKDFVPVREGLSFGGWFLGDEEIGGDLLMPADGLTLTARYKADYSVNVYYQNADDPETYDFMEHFSLSGSDYLGETVRAALPGEEHFFLEERSQTEGALQAGKNEFNVYYSREPLRLTYLANEPGGGTKARTVDTRYGAHITTDLIDGPNGYTFFGWAREEGGAPDPAYACGKTVTVTESLTLYGAWAKVYRAARGEGELAIAEYGEGIKDAVYTVNGVKTAGKYDEQANAFEAGAYRGKLDGYGGFLPDDSGEYAGYGLLESGVDEKKYGTLSLDFSAGTALYTLGGERHAGEYVYCYDSANARYTGTYLFRETKRSGEEFYFMLTQSAAAPVFLRQGEERGEYPLYDVMTDKFSAGDVLTLDGFGGAVWTSEEGTLSGVYRGAAEGNGEWEFSDGGTSFRFLAGGREWTADGAFCGVQRGYLRYRADRAGVYLRGEERLELDGYGYRGRYITQNGVQKEGAFCKDGVFVSLGEYRFTLQGDGFAPTGEEAGVYRGGRGELFLDGAGIATLGGERGEYRAYGQEWLFGDLRFRLSGEEYEVYHPALAGEFESFYGHCLTLDGYGGGSYLGSDGGKTQISVGYAGHGYLELKSKDFVTRAHSLTFFSDGSYLTQIQRPEAGSYSFEGGSLFLAGDAAYLALGETEEEGTYTYYARTSRIEYLSPEGKLVNFLLSEGTCKRQGLSGVFSGAGRTVTLDGYGSAVYGGETYPCEADGGRIDLKRGDDVLRFHLGEAEGEIADFGEYLCYRNPLLGELYLQKEGTGAFFGGGEEGIYSQSGDAYVFGEYTFKLFGREYKLYDSSREGTYRTPSGELVLDGCGGGEYRSGDLSVKGETEYLGSVIVLRSDDLMTVSGCLAFKTGSVGELVPLGTEYGTYFAGEGELFLDGEGGAAYSAGGKQYFGSYAADGEGYIFENGRRFVLERTERGAECLPHSEALEGLAGEYEGEFGLLSVTAFGVTLQGKRCTVLWAGECLLLSEGGMQIVLRGGEYAAAEINSRFLAS